MEQPDLIVCSLPPYDLAYQAARYASQRSIPLIVDARDYWPDIFVDLMPVFLRPLARLALHSEFRLAREAFRHANSITAMSEDNLDWALSYCDREKADTDRVFHLGFRAPPKLAVDEPEWLRELDGRFIVAFIGTFSRFHSPLILARAAKQLQMEGRKDIAIVIAGAGGDIEPKVKKEVVGLLNVTMPGWLDQAGIDALLSRAAIGVCPTSTDAKFFPNKTFLYFSRGLPVLSAFQGELRTVLDRDGLGHYFHHDDATELAKHIKALCDDPTLYEKTRTRVEQAFRQRYDEKVVYAAFADHIESLAAKSGQRR
jgi:glycosyltransferase involved in cell wall biosynthesis